MSDLEISKALALAIGWVAFQQDTLLGTVILVYTGGKNDRVRTARSSWLVGYRVFDYRDWNVIGPIAERYNCFPWPAVAGWIAGSYGDWATTPQKAIALAVINGAKK